MTYVWLAVVVFAIVLEAVTAALVSIWFVPAGVISMVLALLNLPIWLQVTAFLILSAVFVFVFRSWFCKGVRKNDTRTNLDAVIGADARVIERICNIDGKGAVKVMGKEWSARSVDDEIYDEGDIVRVIEIRGVKLIVEKIK